MLQTSLSSLEGLVRSTLPPALLPHSFLLSSVLFGFLIAASLYLVYRIIFRTPQRTPVQFFDRKSETFEALRRNSFPPPYPNGWWKVCDLSDLDNGRIQTVTALGLDLVVFRGADGQVGALDAFCPHIGANLGQGGKVVGNTIQCPFHGWKFNASGDCVDIPYCTSTIPSTAKTQSYPVRIWLDMVFVWFDAEGRPPQYEIMPRDEFSNWNYHGCYQTSFDMHVAEMAENSADYYHFNSLHAPLPLPILDRLFTVHHELNLYFSEDPNLKHVSYFDNWGEIYFLKHFKLAFTRQKTVVTFEGPSIVHFRIDSPAGSMHLVKTLLPIAPFKVYSEDRWYAEKKVPRILIRLVALIAKGALEQDRQVWENKKFNAKPNLVKGDGPFPAHRRWFRQFYSEKSREWAYRHTRLEW